MKDRNYNKTKKRNKIIRFILPNPFKSFGKLGTAGTIAGMACKKAIKKPVHLASWFITGLFYEKGNDKSSTGSNIYTFVYAFIIFVISVSVILIMQKHGNIFMFISSLLKRYIL